LQHRAIFKARQTGGRLQITKQAMARVDDGLGEMAGIASLKAAVHFEDFYCAAIKTRHTRIDFHGAVKDESCKVISVNDGFGFRVSRAYARGIYLTEFK